MYKIYISLSNYGDTRCRLKLHSIRHINQVAWQVYSHIGLDSPPHCLIARPGNYNLATTSYLSVSFIYVLYWFGNIPTGQSLFVLSGIVRFCKTLSMRYWLFEISFSFLGTSCLSPLYRCSPLTTNIRGVWSLF